MKINIGSLEGNGIKLKDVNVETEGVDEAVNFLNSLGIEAGPETQSDEKPKKLRSIRAAKKKEMNEPCGKVRGNTNNKVNDLIDELTNLENTDEEPQDANIGPLQMTQITHVIGQIIDEDLIKRVLIYKNDKESTNVLMNIREFGLNKAKTYADVEYVSDKLAEIIGENVNLKIVKGQGRRIKEIEDKIRAEGDLLATIE